ncbi:MAG: hypothetical protein WC832_00115 [Anaerolineales bacterium]
MTATKKLIHKKRALPILVIDKLADGGLIVTDGSMCSFNGNPYSFFLSTAEEVRRTNDLETKTYIDSIGNRFNWVGIAGKRSGTISLIWRVRKGIE